MVKKVTFFSGTLKMGGPQRVMVALSEKFINDGIEVNFVTTVNNEVEYELHPSIKHITVPETSNNKILKILQKIIWLRKVLKSNDSDVFISFWYTINMYLMVSSFFLNKKIIISERNDPNREPGNKILRRIRNFLYQFADKVVFQTRDAKEYFSSMIQQKSTIIPNPIREDLPERFIGTRRKEVVNFCRLSPQKNLFLLIDAFNIFLKNHSDYILTIYGRGEQKSQLINYIKKLNLQSFVYIRDFELNIHDKILDSNMFVSSSDFEGISNSMLEALAVGLPTICTDCPIGGARAYVNSYENGILVPINDKYAMSEAMEYIADNPDEAERFSKNATKLKRLLNSDVIYKKWRKALEDIFE